jgi:enterochelin esterase-like enzyme
MPSKFTILMSAKRNQSLISERLLMIGRILLSLLNLAVVFGVVYAKDDYQLGPDSMVQPNVPKGELHEHKNWESKIFDGTVRDFWVYVPKQYDGKEPACVMVFQDGGSYKNPKGSYRAPTVMDNLIHKKEIPVMIGIFIDPGKFPGKDGKKGGSNRSFEYDTLSPQYSQFLEKEILPEVSKKFNLRTDAAGRGICGASSGGICAFTVAWERPDMFSKVLSHIGSFANIRGGDRYPGIIRKAKPKPIRVFLQDGSNDLNNDAGDWWLGNLQMASALRYKKYDYTFAWGDGGHTGKHGGSILPESMRWLWRDTPPPPPSAKTEEKK